MANDILKVVPMVMGLSLLEENVKETKKKKPNLMKLGMEDVVGMAMISETSKFLD